VSGQLHALAALPPREEPPVRIGEEAVWVPEPVWTMWRREYPWLYRDSNSDRSLVQPVFRIYGVCQVLIMLYVPLVQRVPTFRINVVLPSSGTEICSVHSRPGCFQHCTRNLKCHEGLKVLTAVTKKNSILWDRTPCSVVKSLPSASR
jgi:hypothetical protein